MCVCAYAHLWIKTEIIISLTEQFQTAKIDVCNFKHKTKK